MLIYIIDAFNLIHKIHPIRDSAFPHTDFIQFLKAHKLTGSPRNRAILVFDGHPPPEVLEENKYKIIFSKGKTADDLIKALIDKEKKRGELVIVSDDKEIQGFARMSGVKTKSTREFLKTTGKTTHTSSDDKQISHSTKEKITKELEELWLKR